MKLKFQFCGGTGMTVDTPDNNSKERGLFYSGLAAGAMHMLLAVVALCLAINGMQKSSNVTIVHLVSGELNPEPQSPSEQPKPQRSAIALARAKAPTVAINKTVRDVAAETPTKSLTQAQSVSVAAAPVGPSTVQTSAPREVPGLSLGQPIDVKFGDSSGLNFRHREIPEYPFAARRMNKEGDVLLRLTIDEKGKLLDAEVVRGAEFGFTEAALEAARKSSYDPARRNGIAVKSRALWPFRFRLVSRDDN
jgi:periplasmic protein TonB